jgi:hypothetical protein
MGSIVLFGFRDFGSKTQLDNLAQDVALRIVEAQKAAISGRSTATLFGIDTAHAPSYGVYFSDNAIDTGGLNRQFTYFADNDHSKTYSDVTPCPASPTPGHECISVTSITTGEYVSNICYYSTSTVYNCVEGGSAHITFTRPFPDATMNVCNDTGITSCTALGASVPETFIELTSGADPTQQKTIIVTSLGEVRVYNGGAHDACLAGGLAGC